MKRRAFLGLLASLPLVGRLVPKLEPDPIVELTVAKTETELWLWSFNPKTGRYTPLFPIDEEAGVPLKPIVATKRQVEECSDMCLDFFASDSWHVSKMDCP